MTKRRVAIVGAATSDFGRVDDKSAFELHHQATSRALADAGHRPRRGRRLHVPRHRGPPAHRAGRVPGPGRPHRLHRLHRRGRLVLGDVPRARRGRHRPGPDRHRRPLLRVDLAGRPEAAVAHGQPLLRQQGARSSSTPPSATPSSPSTPCRPGATCTSSAPPSSSWPRSPSRPATTPGSTPTPTTATPSPSRTSSPRG